MSEPLTDQQVRKLVHHVWCSPKGTYYAAIRFLAQIVAEELPEWSFAPASEYEAGMYAALAQMVESRVLIVAKIWDPERILFTSDAYRITDRLLEIAKKNPRTKS